MVRRVVGVLLAMVLALAGCGGDGGGGGGTAAPSASSATPTPTPTPTPSATVTDAQLKTALLATTDMPSGWSVSPDDDDEEDDSGDDECPELSALEDEFERVPDAEVSFSKDQLGPFFNESIGAFASVEEVTRALTQYDAALAKCKTFTMTDEESGEKIQATVGPLSFAKLGDHVVSYRMSMKFDAGMYTLDTAIVRVRNYAVLVVGSSVRTSIGGGQISTAELEALARKAVDKVASSLP